MNKKVQNQKNAQVRPPVVAVLGHIDHGKSSILQSIKDLKITEKEAGGITQHIGAYEVEENSKKITFIDTPGHEAFSAMRSRGAKVADIAILVIAGEEGVKEQTKEAISFIKKAQIPMIVAINKMDKPEANPKKVKRELSQNDIMVEDLGGEVPVVETSAKTGKGIDDLLEVILLVAEMEELKTNLDKKAKGVIIESYLDSKRGPTATLILKQGTLKKGTVLGTNSTAGKVKILENFQGKRIDKALPSQPIVILGFSKVPQIGEKVKQFDSLKKAEQEIKEREERRTVLEVEEGEQVLNLIVKVDVLGSIEAIESVLNNLPQEKLKLRIVKSEVGEITEKDIKLGESAKATIIGFRVGINKKAQRLNEEKGVKIMTFDVIYDLVEELRKKMERKLKPELVREELGQVRVLVVFKSGKRQIVGGRISRGEVTKGTLIDILREGKKVGSGKLINLQKNKKDVERLVKGDECGILYQGEGVIKKGDTLLIYTQKEEKGKL